MSGDRYLWDRSGEVDPEIEELEKKLGALRYQAPPETARADQLPAQSPEVRPRPRSASRRTYVYAGLALAAAVALGIGLRKETPPADPGPTFAVTRIAGAPRVGAAVMGEVGRLPIGPWLETDNASRAHIAVAQIGDVDVDPGSRLRLVATTPHEHRLELARGTIHARVVAPPRLFVIDTPGATAFDLGCAYRLDVDEHGVTLLQVESGQVSLEGHGRSAWVPAGAACETRPHGGTRGPGTPYFLDASEPLQKAIHQVDREEGDRDGALRTIRDTSRPRDALSLWHLMPIVSEEERIKIRARLSELAPIPEGVLPVDAGVLPSKFEKGSITHW